MPIEHIVWRFLSKSRLGTFLACLLIPELIVVREVSMKPFSSIQRLVWIGIGAAMGMFAFGFLTCQDWLKHAIGVRRSRQEGADKLELMRVLLYVVVLPVMLFIVLLVVVIFWF